MLVYLHELDGHIPPKNIHFSSKVFWVQVHNMSLARMSREVGNLICQGLAKVMEVKVDGNGFG